MKCLEIGDIDFADLGLSVGSIFVDDTLGVPAGKLANDTNNASGAMLAVVAMDKKGVILAIENDAEDCLHGLGRDSFLLRSLHVEDDLSNSIGCDKRLQITIEFFLLDQGPATC